MERVRELLELVLERGIATGHFLGLLHVLIGRRITDGNDVVVSTGLTWRDVANELRRSRWSPEVVRELGLDPGGLSPRDRFRFWYQAIAQANVGSAAAAEAGDRLAALLTPLGYRVSVRN